MKVSKPPSGISFPKLEEKLLDHWEQHKTFEKSVEGLTAEGQKREGWFFYDGPPFATGLPHYGHLLAGTIKDVIPRYWTMQGKSVERRFGWDCHGLPIEFELEKELGLKGRQDILNFGVGKFNEACRGIVMRYSSEWEKTVRRMGRWIDFKRDYKTMNVDFMESVWNVFQQLWNKGLIYEDKKVLPYSTPVASPLSNFEANLNYQDTQDPSVYVKLKVTSFSEEFAKQIDPHILNVSKDNVFLVVWTTTPWTLPANLGVAVNTLGGFPYVAFKLQNGDILIGHKKLLGDLLNKMGEKNVSVLLDISGDSLVGTKYSALFPDAFGGKGEGGKIPLAAHQVFAAEYVTADSGTGLVHLAPAFGEEDFNVGKANGLEALDHLDEQGHFLSSASISQGKYFKEADKDVIASLKERHLLLRQETLQHSYPFCYRSDTPLIYRAISTWFVKVTAIKEELLKNNAQIHWVPEHVKDGRFGKWLEGAKDWAISRNRFWGNPIPVWRHNESGDTICVGSQAELEELSGKKLSDLHKHFVDDVVIVKNGKTYTRVSQVLDCWFESGSMPYAQRHVPFSMSNTEFKKVFPADFIAEGLDQTRGWFYTLSVLSAALGYGPAFKNVVVNGIVLAEDGRKMSKRLKNYPQPEEVLNEFGADALRIYLLQSAAVHGDDLRFSKAQMTEMMRKVLLPFWNAYVFFSTYAAIDGFDPQTQFVPSDQRNNQLDQWIFAKLKRLSHSIQTEMSQYHLAKTIPPMLAFIDELNNWYIRRSRRRFWKSENDGDKFAAFSTLYEVLVQFSKITAPFIPFLSEEIYLKLRLDPKGLTKSESVHLESYPRYEALSKEESSSEKIQDAMREIVALGRELREKLKIKTRQPLALSEIGGLPSDLVLDEAAIESLRGELNVKEIRLRDSKEMASWKAKPNFKMLGKVLGPQMKEFQLWCQNLGADEVLKIRASAHFDWKGLKIESAHLDVVLEPSASYALPSHSSGTVILSFQSELTESLQFEGMAREIIHQLQEMRKSNGWSVEDKIDGARVQFLKDNEKNCAGMKPFETLIQAETLTDCVFTSHESDFRHDQPGQTNVVSPNDSWLSVDINGQPILVHLPTKK